MGILVSGLVNAEPAGLWNVTAGGGDRDEGYSVAVDSENNIIITGVTESFAGFSGREIIDQFGNKNADFWTIKYDANGKMLWNKTAGGDYWDEAKGVAVDSKNNIIVTGSTAYSPDFLHFSLSRYYKQFLKEGEVHLALRNGFKENNVTLSDNAKLSKPNEYNWEIADDKNSYLISGLDNDNLDVFTSRNPDILTIKYDSFGNVLWNKTFGESGWYYGESVAVDSNDNIIVAGHANSFDEREVGGRIIKYDSQGNLLWNKTAGGSPFDEFYGAAVDSNNNIIIAGFMRSSDVGSTGVVKYDSNGNLLWNKTPSMNGWGRGYGVAVDSDNNIIVVGSTNLQYYGPGVGVLTIKYSPGGNMLWNKTASGIYDNSFDSGRSVAVDSNDNIIVAGYTERITAIENYETIIWENTTYYVVEGIDSFYYTEPPVERNYELWTIKYDPSGNLIWNKTEGGIDRDMGFGAAVDSNDDIIVAGVTNSFGTGKEDVWVIKYDVGRNERNQNTGIYVIAGVVILALILLFIVMLKRKNRH